MNNFQAFLYGFFRTIGAAICLIASIPLGLWGLRYCIIAYQWDQQPEIVRSLGETGHPWIYGILLISISISSLYAGIRICDMQSHSY